MSPSPSGVNSPIRVNVDAVQNIISTMKDKISANLAFRHQIAQIGSGSTQSQLVYSYCNNTIDAQFFVV